MPSLTLHVGYIIFYLLSRHCTENFIIVSTDENLVPEVRNLKSMSVVRANDQSEITRHKATKIFF